MYVSFVLDNKRAQESSFSVLKEFLLNRFDVLDSGARKVLQTCAVLGNEFSDLDVYRVQPEMDPVTVSFAFTIGVSEMILVELVVENDDDNVSRSLKLGGSSVEISKTSSTFPTGQRIFEFSHSMWRSTVLDTMLNERKRDLHRKIASSMEVSSNLLHDRSDLARLLMLFEHWKSSGDFKKAARLALFVGKRLGDWELLHQSVDIYRDVKDLCFGCVHRIDKHRRPEQDDWVLVSAKQDVMEVIIRLHITMAETFMKLSDLEQCLNTLKDAYMVSLLLSKPCVVQHDYFSLKLLKILSSSSGAFDSLMIPTLASLCTILDETDPGNEQLSSLIREFVDTTRRDGSPLHISRALAMEAGFYANRGNYERALEAQKLLQTVYNAKEHSRRLVKVYEKDHAMECSSQSILWSFLGGYQDESVCQAEFVIRHHLPLHHPHDVNAIMALLLPTVLVFKFVGRASDALYIFGKHVINPHHEFAPSETYWVELFNPLMYLLQVTSMEEEDTYDGPLVDSLESWVLNEANSYYSPHHLRMGHTFMGEICCRLGQLKQADDPERDSLMQKARFFLTPIARDVESEHEAWMYPRGIAQYFAWCCQTRL